jgi:AcrR family transcriptional regulator
VSPNAALPHFADHRALLRAVCAHAMALLARAMEAEQAALPQLEPQSRAVARLRAVGAGYLRYAQGEPGLFRTAFTAADELTDEDDAAGDQGLSPFGLLSAALDDLVEVGVLPAARRPDAELTAWSAVHGLSMLLFDGPLKHLDRAHTERIEAQLLDHVEIALLGDRPATPPRAAGRTRAGRARR